MNVVEVMPKILIVTNPVVSETAFPDFTSSADDVAEGMRIAAFDQLNGMFECGVIGGSK